MGFEAGPGVPPPVDSPEVLKGMHANQEAAAENQESAGAESAEGRLAELRQSLPELKDAFQNIKESLFIDIAEGGKFTVAETDPGTVPADVMMRLQEFINRLSQINVGLGAKDAILENRAAGVYKMEQILADMLGRTNVIHTERLFHIIEAALDSAERGMARKQ